ncbi:OpgC family protein [Devosia sediminis]|uniref:OpgC domain-containing protein n=1 Tax=Devosia sediminis TaxID=2798801 RepID=A0A934IWQ2_9HYPH|nr:OpgC domain-containing protein [Devosia sediminis]MBJ3786486.1 OpgC domain-containing protein [Devosia sediminis]
MSLHDVAPPSPVQVAWQGLRAALVPQLSRDVSGVVAGRDPRLDMFRGLALVMIFINHVPGTMYEGFTNRNYGFSDAAEAFVFMSGMAAGLAYSGAFRSGSLWSAVMRVWARARQLYFVHIAITMLCLAIFAGAALWFEMPVVLMKNNVEPVLRYPLQSLIGIPLLTHQLGYLNILPLYAVLLVAAPVFILVGLRRPWLMLALSIALWALAGQFRINLPNFPNSGGWFFNPFSWQILFVIGLLSGMAMKSGGVFIPFNRVLYGLAAAFLVFVLLWVKIPELGAAGHNVLAKIADAGAPFYITWFDKSYLALPRLLHALALFYVLGHMPLMMRLAASRFAAPLREMGRQGLAVFATGTVISLFLQVVKTPRQPDPLFDGFILGTGLLVLLVLAMLLNYTARLRTTKATRA